MPLAACLPVPVDYRASILPKRFDGCSALARADEPPVAPVNRDLTQYSEGVHIGLGLGFDAVRGAGDGCDVFRPVEEPAERDESRVPTPPDFDVSPPARLRVFT